MRRTEAWWVCDCCGAAIMRVGKGKKKGTAKPPAYEHRDVCPNRHIKLACYSIRQVEQGKRSWP